MAGLFLALLELIRLRLVWVEQPRRLGGPIYIRPLTDEPAEQAVRNAIIAREQLEQTGPDKPKAPPIPIRQLPAKKRVPAPGRDDAPADASSALP